MLNKKPAVEAGFLHVFWNGCFMIKFVITGKKVNIVYFQYGNKIILYK